MTELFRDLELAIAELASKVAQLELRLIVSGTLARRGPASTAPTAETIDASEGLRGRALDASSKEIR